MKTPREIAHEDDDSFCAGLGHDRMCDRDTRMLARGMAEALRWAKDEASWAGSVNDAFQCIQEELARLEKL
jgi:hypothetical protein